MTAPQATRWKSVALMVGTVFALSLGGCSEVEDDTAPVEQLELAPLELVLLAQGQLRSSKAVPLLVPGEQWAQRQLVWMAADGSHVEAGDVVARFSAPQAELGLANALLDLQRNQLARLSKQDDLGNVQGRVDVDLTQVGSELTIAQRYAEADLEMFARNQILDAIQDRRFLGEKRGVLEWQRGQAGSRGETELAVLDSQRATYEMNRERRATDLAALELVAPNAGVLVLSTNWSNEKPRLGATLWAGNEFATLPDSSALEVELVLPQLEAQGLVTGTAVELHPLGRPQQSVTTELSWIASAATVRNRQNPVKFIKMKAPVAAETAKGFGWVPGQAFAARIVVHRSDAALSVPNIAVISDDGKSWVQVRDGGTPVRREVRLGARGPARSEVLEGLSPGDAVLLTAAPPAEASP